MIAACSGEPSVTVPDVTTRYPSPAQAEASLVKVGLTANYPDVPRISGAVCGVNGYAVLRQSPAAGASVDRGTRVDLMLGMSANGGGICPGEPSPGSRVTIPDVRGREVNDALATLTGLGMLVDVAPIKDQRTLTVATQSPAGGQRQLVGTRVRLTIAE